MVKINFNKKEILVLLNEMFKGTYQIKAPKKGSYEEVMLNVIDKIRKGASK